MTKINVKLDNKAKNVISKTAGISGGGGGLTPVDKLPEKGNVGTLYKTPDGNIYSWFHEERQEKVEVPDFSVGGTYQMQNSVPADALYGLTTKDMSKIQLDSDRIIHLSLSTPLNEDLNFIHFTISHHVLHGEDDWVWESCIFADFEGELHEDSNCSQYMYQSNGKPVLEVELDNHFSQEIFENPYITITQEFANKLTEEGFTLEDIAFMFITGTKTETITVVEEGYTQLNGIVLDYNKIVNNAIFLDDKNYNAQIIYDTLLRGGNVSLKKSVSEDRFGLQCLKSVAFGTGKDGIHGALMIFENNNIDIVLENQFNPISTIKGQELINLIQAYQLMEINNVNLINYIGSVLSREETTKALYRGVAISLFEGLIEYDLFYPLPDEELAPSNVTQIAHFVPKAYRDDVLTAYPEKGQLNCLEFLAQYIGNGYVSNSNLSEIDATKDYNCDIIVKFSDGTIKTVPMDKRLLYGEEGNDESPLFRIHYPN